MACGGGCCSAASGTEPKSLQHSQDLPTHQDEQNPSQVDEMTENMVISTDSCNDLKNTTCAPKTKLEDGDCCDMLATKDHCATSSPPMPSENGQNISSNNCDEVCGTKTDLPKETCEDGCCSADSETSSSSCASEADLCGGGCCKDDEKAESNTHVMPTECTSTSYSTKGGQASCCDNDGKCSQVRETVQAIQVRDSSNASKDIEKGVASLTHVVLSITGMTCTGCETKLRRTLGTLSDVKNFKTSLVLARTEFDIEEHSGTTVDDVIEHLHRTTEFKCEHISNRGASLDFTCSGNVATFVNSIWPDGVLDVKTTGKQAIRVEYDAHLIGARDLLREDWAKGLDLAPPNSDAGLVAGTRHVRHMGLMTLLSAALTLPVLVMAWAPLPENQIAYGSASLALATLVQVVVAGPFYPKAIKALVFSRVIEMDLLIVLSTSAAYIFSVVSFGYLVDGRPLATGEFFETSTLLVTLIMVGRFVASLARQKAAESVSIRSLQTAMTTIISHDGTEMEIDVRLLQFGDKFKIAPDTRIPTDGTVLSGSSEVDESMLTGETIPIEKHSGSAIIAGSINGSGMLVARLTRLPGDNTITTIACMVDEAKLSKPKIQETADKVASYFVPVVVALAVITFVIWVAVGMTIRSQSGSRATIEALTYAITVLIVSCPCAIGLAVPMVIVVASGIAARRGVIFKTSVSMEVAYKTTHVVFDKTGTLTMGELAVVDEVYLGKDVESIKSLLLGVVYGIKHPVSAAVAAYLLSNDVVATEVDNPTVLPGKGVQANFKGRVLRAGNSRWLDTASHHSVQAVLSSDLTVFCFKIDASIVAVFGLQDKLRPDAHSTLSSLAAEGITVHLLSGDDEGAVRTVASQLHIPAQHIRSQCSPADKQAYVLDIQSASPSSAKQQQAVVMFVGDGTNDAVALTQATIGVHVSSGTDIAQSAADIVLVRPNLIGILSIIHVSKKAMQRVWFNFGWSFFYNTFAVLLAAGAFVHARIPPEYAGLGELVSVLPVIIAAVLLRWEKI